MQILRHNLGFLHAEKDVNPVEPSWYTYSIDMEHVHRAAGLTKNFLLLVVARALTLRPRAHVNFQVEGKTGSSAHGLGWAEKKKKGHEIGALLS